MVQQQRKVRRDKGLIQATERDLHIIAWIAHQYACRQDHLRELLSREPGASLKDPENALLAMSTLKDQIDRWRKAGWIEYERFLAHEPAWAWVTKRGLQLVGLDHLYLAKVPALVTYRHLWAINEVRLWWYEAEDVREDNGEVEWIGERRLRAEMSIVKKHPDHIPASIRISEGMIPDAVVVGDGWADAVEIELTPKKPADLQEKLRRLCHSSYEEVSTGKEYIYNHVRFYVPSKAMQQHVERASMHLTDDERESVDIYLDEKLQPLAKR